MPECLVFRVPAQHPADVSQVMGLVASGAVEVTEIVAIFGKTEGNGCVNDFTRQLAVMALETALATALGCTAAEVGARIALVMSGGTEGGLSPHFLVLARRDGPAVPVGKALAIGTAFTQEFGRRRSAGWRRSRRLRRRSAGPWQRRGSPIPPTCISCR